MPNAPPTSKSHEDCVDRWLSRVERELEPLQLLELAMEALFARASPTLGSVTLAAIVARVRLVTVEKYPAIEVVAVSETGVTIDAHSRTAVRGENVRDGVRFFLIEFLTIIGSVTAGILTPALHATLSRTSGKGPR